MKKIILVIVLFLGIYPCVHKGKIHFSDTNVAYADDFGSEDNGGDNNNPPDYSALNSALSTFFGFDVVDITHNSEGDLLLKLADGSILDPNVTTISDSQIASFAAESPELFPPDVPLPPASDFSSLGDFLNFVSEQQPPPPPPKTDPCKAAKDLTDALNAALAIQGALDSLSKLEGTSGSKYEHGFMISKDASGYHVSEVIKGTTTTTPFTYDPNTVIFIFHVHPPEASAAPSSTDLLGLNDYGTGFQGDIIIHGDDRYLISVTDQKAYDKFITESNKNNYKDVKAAGGWRDGSAIGRDFDSFSRAYTTLYRDDATFPTQIHLMSSYSMGVTLQKWDPTSNKFQPLEVNAPTNTSTGATSTITGGGTPVNSKYDKIEVNKKNCP